MIEHFCYKCGEWSPEPWEYSETVDFPCDRTMCGDHPGIICPKCGEVVDSVMTKWRRQA